jgi:DNA polymerase III delta prime subunit
MDIANSLWVEKYRPKNIDDVVLKEDYKNDFKRMIERNDVGNLLFSGSPGSGKSTIARIFCSKQGVLQNKRSNLLEINGSAKETRGIGFVSDVIEPFFRSPPVNDKFKILFIDEADAFKAYDTLRGVIEKYQIHYGRFILTCNYISHIPEPIQSRFSIYKFKQLPKEFVYKYCERILNSEKVEFKKEDVEYIINNLYPDIRQCVNVLNRSSFSGKLSVNSNEVITNEKKIIFNIVNIISDIKNGNKNKIGKYINEIIHILKDHEIDYSHVYEKLFYMDQIPIPCKIVINEYANNHQNCLIPSMHFNDMCFKLGTVLTDYYKMKN